MAHKKKRLDDDYDDGSWMEKVCDKFVEWERERKKWKMEDSACDGKKILIKR